MKALLLAGGKGSRLLPFTRTMPKQLLPVANRPVLAHAVEHLRSVGARDVGVVVGEWGRQIRDSLGDGSRFGVRLTYLRQDSPDGLAHCVGLARSFLGDDDFVVYLGDNLFKEGLEAPARTFRERGPQVQLTVQPRPDPRDFGVAVLTPGNRVLRVVEKPDHPPSDLAVLGAYFFRPSIHEAISSIRPSPRGELELTDAVQWLVDRGDEVTAVRYDGYWRDVGRVEDLLESGRHYLEGLTPDLSGALDAESSVEGAVEIGSGAKVMRSRIIGPVMVGEGTVIEDSVVGPGVTVGRDCHVRAASIARSTVLDGVTVDGGDGFSGCLVGPEGLLACQEST